MKNLPGFTAESALEVSVTGYRTRGGAPSGAVVPQDCGFWKGLGCTLGPFSWCALAGLGGAAPFWDCVDKASGGSCLECLSGADPRDPDKGGNPDDYVGGSYNTGTGFHGGGSYGQGLSVDDPSVQRQLDRIERCACGPLRKEIAALAAIEMLAPDT